MKYRTYPRKGDNRVLFVLSLQIDEGLYAVNSLDDSQMGLSSILNANFIIQVNRAGKECNDRDQ